MRDIELSELVSDLRALTGRSTRVNVGVDALDNDKTLLRTVQERLWQEHSWPFLNVYPVKVVSAGERYYDVPTELAAESILAVHAWFGGRWLQEPVARGISTEHYSVFDSDADERSDPIQRWELRWTGTVAQIEVWPMPATTGKLRITGSRALRPLVANTDRCDLDDRLIVLTAAADVLGRQGAKDAGSKAAAAIQLLHRLQANNARGKPMSTYGGSPVLRGRQPPRIVISG